MIGKVGKKIYRVGALAMALWVLAPMGRVIGMDVLGGSLIPSTPFDRRLNMAGGLQAHFETKADPLRSSEGLFLLARSMRYVPDPAGQDTWQTPEQTQNRWAGDCEDKALWLFSNLKRNGYSKVRLVVGRYRTLDKNFHVWVTLVDDQDRVLILDPTAQKKSWKKEDFDAGFYKPLYSFDGINRYRHDS